MRGTSLVFTQRIVNAENTLLNEAEVLVVCVDPVSYTHLDVYKRQQ